MTCPICIEDYTASTRAVIRCTKCEFECCKVCFKRYVTDEDHYLSCMSCNTTFDRSTLFNYLGQTFMKTIFRDIRQVQLYETEKTYFATTQLTIDHLNEIEKLKEERDALDVKYNAIRKERLEPVKKLRYCKDVMPVCEAIDLFMQLQLHAENVDEELKEEREQISRTIHDMEHTNEVTTKRTYVLMCTDEECKGMLARESINENNEYVCSICKTKTCVECQVKVNDDKHKCDPNIIESLKFMNNTSKPCPTCSALIFKISGCNQMFCTNCHTSFDWRTLKINNGQVHNPHHAEWLRNNRNRPRELGDIVCGRELTIDLGVLFDKAFKRSIQAYCKTSQVKQQYLIDADYLFDAIRMGIHHNHVTMPSLNRNTNSHQHNQRLRIQLLTNTITKDEFMREIQKKDKQVSKRNELLQIVLTYRDALIDVIWPFVPTLNKDRSLGDWVNLLQQVRELVAYIDNCFYTISQVYGTVRYEILSDRTIR